MSVTTCLLVMLGGALGSLSRYVLSVLSLPISGSLPWGTIAINVLGSFIIGLFGTFTLAQGRFPLPEPARIFVMVGFCGGFTTFSSFSLQTLDLLRGGATWRAAINVGASVSICIAAVSVGHVVAARLNGGATQIAQTALEEDA